MDIFINSLSLIRMHSRIYTASQGFIFTNLDPYNQPSPVHLPQKRF